MATFPIIGIRRTPEEFRKRVRDLVFDGTFHPQFVVVHNTSTPTLAQRPNGFNETHMKNLVSFYANEMGFKGGPHLFIDDKGIWEFNPLNLRGTHSPSWNKISWGVEMLGEYERDEFTSGRGAKVAENAVQAVAALCEKLSVPVSTIRFHKEDPLTSHTSCPGKKVIKVDFLERVEVAMDAKGAFNLLVNGEEIGTALQPNEDPQHAYTPARPLLNALFSRDEVSARIGFDDTGSTPRLQWDDKDIPANVFVRAPGVAWVAIRGIVDWLNLGCKVTTTPKREIRLTKP